MSVALGTANYDGNKKKTFVIKDGDNVYRILPPMKSCAASGHWSKYFNVVWGYENKDGKKRPFNDCRKTNYNTKMVEVESEAYLKSAKFSAILEGLKLKKKNGETVDPEMLKKATELSRKYNIEGKHYVNAVNLKGEIGVLKIGVKAKQGIEAEIKKLLATGVDPLSVNNGRYFNIYREGTGLSTMYQTTVYKEAREVNGEMAEFPKVHAMDATFIARLDKEASDLALLYQSPTPDQIKQIVEGADPDKFLSAAKEQAPAQDDEVAGAEAAGASGENKSVGPSAAELAATAAAEEARKIAAKTASDLAAAEAKKLSDAKAEAEKLAATTAEGAAAGSTAQSDAEWLKTMGM